MGSSSSRSFSPNKNGNCAANIAKAPRNKKDVMGNRISSTSSSVGNNEYVEAVVCSESDLKENEMKVFDMGEDGKVLLVKQNGEINALGTKCSHYGAPLVGGALGDGRIRCPWHGACFNLKSGDIEDFPGLDSIPCYQVSIVEDGKVKVRAKKSELKDNIRQKTLAKRKESNTASYVVVGGGPSAATCVETLRAEGFVGKLLMIASESYLPYDRIKLSKLGLQTNINKLQFRNADFYSKNGIEIMNNVEAIKVDPANSHVLLSNGDYIEYDSLYVATGSKARVANIPGVNLKNVFTVRNLADSVAINAAIGDNKDKNVVILGLSFIGLETAASCVDKAASVTVVGKDTEPLGVVFGKEIGAALRKLFDSKGVKFVFKTSVAKCNDDNGSVKSVNLDNGTNLPADVFIMGVGSEPNTQFLRGSGIAMEPHGTVHVNEHLETNIPNVFAGGDIAFAPVFAYGNKKAAIGHIGLAQYHGKIAALNMLQKDIPLKAVPFFWTMLFGKSIRYAGYGKPSSVMIDGDVNELKFVIFFFNGEDNVIAVASCQRDPIVAQYAEYVSLGKVLTKSELQQDMFAWTKALRSDKN